MDSLVQLQAGLAMNGIFEVLGENKKYMYYILNLVILNLNLVVLNLAVEYPVSTSDKVYLGHDSYIKRNRQGM